MLASKLSRLLALSCLVLFGSLVMGSRSILKKLNERPEELASAISSLNWATKLFQSETRSIFELGISHAQLLVKLKGCGLDEDTQSCIVEASNALFEIVIKSASKSNKIGALKAVDSFLNDATAAQLVKVRSNELESLSKAIEVLAIGGHEAIAKNCDSATSFLDTRYNIKDITSIVNPSIWFLLTQLEFFPNSFSRLEWIKSAGIVNIIQFQINLRADVDLELLVETINVNNERENYEVVPWYSYNVEISPFQNIKVYGEYNCWGLVGKSLLLKDPNSAVGILDANFSTDIHGTISYLLLFQENPIKLLEKIDVKNVEGMYNYFALLLRMPLAAYCIELVCKIPKERLEIIIRDLIKFHDNPSPSDVYSQLELSYMNTALLFEKNGKGFDFNTDYARGLVQNSKTFELLDVIGKVSIRKMLFWGKVFNRYLLENNNWDDAVEDHLHHYISLLIAKNYRPLTENLVEYFGISIDNSKALSVLEKRGSICVKCTLDRVPCHLNDYLEIVDNQSQEIIMIQEDRLKIAIKGSILHEEVANAAAHKEDFVRYQLEKSALLSDYSVRPIFVNLARMHHNNKDYDVDKELVPFLYFEHLVYNCCLLGSKRMNLEKGLQKLLNGTDLSTVFKEFIVENFKRYEFPFVLLNLQSLEGAMLKHQPELFPRLNIYTVSTKTLLKTIYKFLDDPFSNFELSFVKHFHNIQLIHK